MIKFGVVEDINDPLKLDRVRVRVFGLHTDNTSLIPTASLPWALVQKPTTSASVSGIGYSGTGLLQGSWVTIDFIDEEQQYPIVTGSIPGNPLDLTSKIISDDEIEFSDSEDTSTNIVKDSQGVPVVASDGTPVTVAPVTPTTPPIVKTPPGKIDPTQLGSISAQYESNGNPGTINAYSNGADSGGASYGSYQFASYLISPGVPSKNRKIGQTLNSPLQQYLKQSPYGTQFSGLSPASPAFDAMWKSVAASDNSGFKSDQHLYIMRTYYQVTLGKVSANIASRGVAIHQAIWSRSVQLGQGGAATLINTAAGNTTADVCDSKIVDLIYQYQIDHVQTAFASSPSLWSGLTKRFQSEQAKLIALAKSYEGNCSGTYTVVDVPKVEYKEAAKVVTIVPTVTGIKSTPSVKRGFADPQGIYPKVYNESDISRIARGVLTSTPTERKRNSVVTGRPAGPNTISEPLTQYNTKYPFNKVYSTESGHLQEFDDTPGYERVHIFHRSGSFVEFHPDGTVVLKSVNSNFTIVSQDNNLIVLGDSNSSIEGNENKTITGDINLTVYGDVNQQINGDLNMGISGTMNVDVETANFTGDVIASGISLVNHTHGGVQKGGDYTDMPS